MVGVDAGRSNVNVIGGGRNNANVTVANVEVARPLVGGLEFTVYSVPVKGEPYNGAVADGCVRGIVAYRVGVDVVGVCDE